MIRTVVVDDYQEHVDTLVNTLNMYGCDAKGCSTPGDAMRLCIEWHPHLIVYDGLMEGMRAWEFGHKLLSNRTIEETHRPYMVALTGFGSTLQRRLCEECGYDEYTAKPIELSTLLTWVQKARQRSERVPGS